MKKILLVGTGYMAAEYLKVLSALERDVIVAGNSTESVKCFNEKTQTNALENGLEVLKHLNVFDQFDSAIVAVSIECLDEVCLKLLDMGIKRILLEKPGALTYRKLKYIREKAKTVNAKIFIAYNRRFYSSTMRAKEIIEEDGGVKSFNFDFTELGFTLKDLTESTEVKERWLVANSSHVIDLAFYLCGEPRELYCFNKKGEKWYDRIYCGHGVSLEGAPFSYMANWASPGRWGVEIATSKHRLILRPLEELHILSNGSFKIDKIMLKNKYDLLFKAGLFIQTQNFVNNRCNELMTIDDQCKRYKYVYGIMESLDSL